MALALAAAIAAAPLPGAAAGDGYEAARGRMLRAIEDTVRLTRDATGRSALDPRVMAALGRVPRHEFVPEAARPAAYENRPLPIGHGQTISQPYIVALMTDLLGVGEESVVLELGTGSGYQAAVLAALVARVFTVEIVEPLGRAAHRRLARLGHDNVRVRIGDGYHGWPEHAPFDAIIVTAAGNHIPRPLVDQLRPGGRMVIPVGSGFFTQQLLLVTKDAGGEVTTRQILPVRFVPLTGGH